MSNFEPIAIVGQGCVIPGSHTIKQFSSTLLTGKTHFGQIQDRRVNHKIIASDLGYEPDKAFFPTVGYIENFDSVFCARDYQLPAKLLMQLDSLFLWSLYAARQACRDILPQRKKHSGVIMGNLCYPCEKFLQLSGEVILAPYNKSFQTQPFNRFSAGFPAQLIARGVGIEGEAFALNAACASGLYAIKLACDKLHRKEADFMLAGAVSSADLFMLSVGFDSLNALSPTGQSRPFRSDADGLVVAEGSVFVGLQRLTDAVKDKVPILGVIRAIGLSNDGSSGGFLTPSTEGQIECIKNAFADSGLEPRDISFIECHATGTAIGDSCEIASIKHIFSSSKPIVIGSVKANLGHLLACAAMAGLLKILASFQHKIKFQNPNAYPLLPVIEDSHFDVLQQNQSWDEQRRIACLNSFGFGGNNAHLIVEEWAGQSYKKFTPKIKREVAVVAIEIKTHLTKNTCELLKQITQNWQTTSEIYNEAVLPAKGMSFPPNDLRQSLGQQLMILELMEKI